MEHEPSAIEPAKNTSGKNPEFIISLNLFIAFVILSMSAFMFFRESRIIKNNFIDYGKREIEHLARKTGQSLGIEELTLAEEINELKKHGSVIYVYILNDRNEVLHYFDRRTHGKDNGYELRKPFNDPVKRNTGNASFTEAISITDYKDRSTGSGIYDFSRVVTSGITKRIKPGTVIIGLSDTAVNASLITSLKVVLSLSFFYLFLSFYIIRILNKKFNLSTK
jgi:hypothetical protein